jgi:hypothetical protein
MLKKFRNVLLDSIQEANLDPRGFKTLEETHEGYDAFRLQAEDGSLFFLLRTRFAGDEREFNWWFSTYKRGHPQPVYNESKYQQWYKFPEAEKHFKGWLNENARKYFADRAEEVEDQTLPDRWAELYSSSATIGDVQVLQNTHFSIAERARVAESLRGFENEIKQRDILTTDQTKLLHEQVDYLIESSNRLGRKDWLNGAIGALLGYTFQAAITSDAATQIMRLGWEAIKWIAHNPLLLP